MRLSRGRYDAQLYTNDKTHLAESLSREVSHRSAMELSHATEPPAQKIEPTQNQTQQQAQTEGQSIGR